MDTRVARVQTCEPGSTCTVTHDVNTSYLFSSLRSGTLRLVLPPGARLVERELAEQPRVSRSPVRAALRLLERDHLATVGAEKVHDQTP